MQVPTGEYSLDNAMHDDPHDNSVDGSPIKSDDRRLASILPLLTFVASMAISNCVLGFYDSRSLLGPTPALQELVTFLITGLAVAQGALVLILGGIVFRHWLVGICVATLVAGLWTGSFFCWHFAIFLSYDHVTGRLANLFSFVCSLPLAVIAGCTPSLIARVAMWRTRPKNNSIIELFAITSFLASVLVLTTLSGRMQTDWEPGFVFFPVLGGLGSAVTITPASLLYFTAADERQGTKRLLLFTAILIGLVVFPVTALARSASVGMTVWLWFALLLTLFFIGLWCMRRSGLGIPSNLQSTEVPSYVAVNNPQRQFIWIIIGAPVTAFIANVIAMYVISN